jgi:dipeptidyl aminopeptidase/acylaminoacyl peptidase
MNVRLIARSVFALLLVAALAPTSALAQAAQSASGQGLPPIIDRELLFGNPEIANARLSPDGQFLAFMKPLDEVRNVWVKRTDEPFDRAKPVTQEKRRPIAGYFWSRDAKFILYVRDNDGDENYNVYAVQPSEVLTGTAATPTARNITDAKGVQAQLYAVPKSDPDTVYVGLNDRDKAWHDLYKVRISTGERTLVRKNDNRFTGWVFDLDDRLRLATRAAENGDTEVLRMDEGGFTKIYTCDVFEQCSPSKFHKDGKRVYMASNKGVDLIRLTLLDVQSGVETPVESDPMNRSDLTGAIFSERTDELIAIVYLDDKPRLLWKDKAFEADYELLRRRLPGKELDFGSSTQDERFFLVNARADVDPGSTYLFDRQTKKLTLQFQLREKLPRESLAPMKTVRYKSSDGLEISAYLTLPKGVEARNLPLIAVPHGGPWARDAWGYDAIAQFLANRGYAVVQPNFRGSTGFGRRFLDAGNRQWGEKMQDDITWGVKHLVAEGIADPKRIGIMGGSYGGYATLAGVAFTPDLYAAAVSIVGPSNLLTLLESIPPYWEAGRTMFHNRLGDPNTPEGRAQLERQSPLTAASKIRTPLLVIQGANDPRVKKAESEQIVVALRDRNFPVEYVLAPDEGHGFARPVNSMAVFAASEKFLARHLGGRYQEGATPEVAERLKVLTVDPKTVVLAKAVDEASVGVPRPSGALRAGTWAYQVKINMGGQNIEVSATTQIAEEAGAWVITETMKTPAGDAVDRGVLDRDTLVLRKRTVTQGPVNVEFESRDGRISGEMKMGGQARPIAADTGGELFADGPGAAHVVAALPLAEGYETTFRNFDVQSQKVRVARLKVVASEQVTVAAGTFETFKVEIAPESGGTITEWVATESRQPVKVTASLPQMNGATMTMELQKP